MCVFNSHIIHYKWLYREWELCFLILEWRELNHDSIMMSTFFFFHFFFSFLFLNLHLFLPFLCPLYFPLVCMLTFVQEHLYIYIWVHMNDNSLCLLLQQAIRRHIILCTFFKLHKSTFRINCLAFHQ